jgi:predicted dehydrogenase
MGSSHVKDCMASDLLELAAICDIDQARLDQTETGPQTKRFTDAVELMDAGDVEAVLIATPHYDHTPIAIAAFERNIHVLCEKPVGVHAKDVEKMISAHDVAVQKNPDLKFAAMFQQRTHNSWRKIKELIDSGELGTLVRASWIITTWFRTQYYYDSGGWRATWKGEGGGVLLNQCPHNLDLYQWFFGMPTRIHGVAAIGKYHRIEVEDEVSATFEHGDGMIGHFITSTAEAPGTNRLEIVGENGRLVFDNGNVTLDRNEQSMIEFSNTAQSGFARPKSAPENVDLPKDEPGAHRMVTEAFARSIREGTPLVAQAREGLNSVTLANGILMSHFTGKPTDVPIDGDAYEKLLRGLIKNSNFEKDKSSGSGPANLNDSF